jgi:hypothetical protein
MNSSQLAAMNSVLRASMSRSLPLRNSRHSSCHRPSSPTRIAKHDKGPDCPVCEGFQRWYTGHGLEIQRENAPGTVGQDAVEDAATRSVFVDLLHSVRLHSTRVPAAVALTNRPFDDIAHPILQHQIVIRPSVGDVILKSRKIMGPVPRPSRNEQALTPFEVRAYQARATGIEPATTGSTVRYSNQLSYAPKYSLDVEIILPNRPATSPYALLEKATLPTSKTLS